MKTSHSSVVAVSCHNLGSYKIIIWYSSLQELLAVFCSSSEGTSPDCPGF